MPDFILPSKLVSERITVRFNFQAHVPFGVTVEFSNFSIIVVSGEDPEHQLMIYGSATVEDDLTIKQKIHRGEPGVIYKLVCEAVGSDNNLYQLTTNLAILPDNGAIPPLSGTYLTSRPYALDVLEGVDSSGSIQNERLWIPPSDSMDSAGAILEGNLGEALEVYRNWPMEGVDSSVSISSGTLINGLVTYSNWPMEGVDSSGLPVSGTLEGGLVSYINWPFEGIDSTASIQSGTLA